MGECSLEIIFKYSDEPYPEDKLTIILGTGLPEGEERGLFCPPEGALFTVFSNLVVKSGRDILT